MSGQTRVANRVGDVLKHWDRGSRTVRTAILSNFIKRHRNSTAAEIEKDLGHGAMLFFTRITAWLRLTYQLGQELSVQLSALSLFVQGQRFMMNFMEVGGIQTLTDILCHVRGPTRDQDKNSAILILIHVANSGRVYREMVCDGNGIDMLVKATLNETNEKTLELMASLFMALGQGNPRKSSLVHSGLLYVMLHGCESGALCAATTLRSLQLAKQAYSAHGGAPLTMVGAESGTPESAEALLNAFFHLLAVDSVKLRFEGTELLSIAAQNNMLIAPIVGRCLERLETQSVRITPENMKQQAMVVREQAACGRILCNIVLSNLSDDGLEKLNRILIRRSAHISLVKYLGLVDGRDVSAQVDCCKALRKLCVTETVSTAGADEEQLPSFLDREQTGGETGAGSHFHLAEWINERVGEVLFDEFVRAEQLSDEVAVAFSKALLAAMESDTTGGPAPEEEEEVDEEEAALLRGEQSPTDDEDASGSAAGVSSGAEAVNVAEATVPSGSRRSSLAGSKRGSVTVTPSSAAVAA